MIGAVTWGLSLKNVRLVQKDGSSHTAPLAANRESSKILKNAPRGREKVPHEGWL